MRAAESGQVQCNRYPRREPVYNAPSDLDFAGALGKVPLSVHLSLYEDETSELCDWHIPEPISWNRGVMPAPTTELLTILQPLIARLFRLASAHELLSADRATGSGKLRYR